MAIAGALFHQELTRHVEEDEEDALMADRPIFGPEFNGQALVAYVRRAAESRGVLGCDAYSLRVGGAQHLGAHIQQHGDLHLAGGWRKGSPMPRHYAGASIEATRWWAAHMIQPVGLLQAGDRPTLSFNM